MKPNNKTLVRITYKHTWDATFYFSHNLCQNFRLANEIIASNLNISEGYMKYNLI